MPLQMLRITSRAGVVKNSRRTVGEAKTAGVIKTTVHKSRKAAVTAEGAVEYFTKIEDREMPITPMMIMIMGCFSKCFILSSFSFFRKRFYHMEAAVTTGKSVEGKKKNARRRQADFGKGAACGGRL